MAVKTKLKYLFHVQYYDGGGFIQTQDDVSKTDPNKSQYYDVEQDKVEYFELIEAEDQHNNYSLHLKDGTFFNQYQQFQVGDPGPKPYKLIFWRQHKHTFNVGSTEELSHEVKYLLGYSDADGKEHTITIE